MCVWMEVRLRGIGATNSYPYRIQETVRQGDALGLSGHLSTHTSVRPFTRKYIHQHVRSFMRTYACADDVIFICT